jgi:hypothetical protein
LFDRLGARVEGGHPQFFERLAPPSGHKAPSHRREFALALLCGHYVHGIGRADVVTGPEVMRRSGHRQPVKGNEFGPSFFLLRYR